MAIEPVRVAVLDDYQGVATKLADWTVLPKHVELTVFRDTLTGEDAVTSRLRPFEIVCAMRERTAFPRRQLERLPNLKLLVTTGMRNASIDMGAARERGITVCGTRGAGDPTAELTWALILGFARSVAREDRNMRTGGWQTTLGVGLEGKVLGVIGLGKLGGKVARIGKAFGMEVVAWSQNLTDERAAEIGARRVKKDELLATADVATIHLVLSDRTRGLIGASDLALMKPHAFLVNTSRGPIVEEAALVEALRQRSIAGAALDVYDTEPLPGDHPFRKLDNVLLSPHLGYVSEENYRAFYRDTVEDIAAYLGGAPVRVINAG
jgi:phosphoglycerate dehydrogenase-like enzyme